VQDLLQHEEGQQPREKPGRRQHVEARGGFRDLGNEMQEGITQQSPGGEGD
jgi:hypothetical protein